MSDVASKEKFPAPKERTPAILIVEDEVLIRVTLADFLQDCGFKVLGAGSVADAIQVLEAEHPKIDLVFSDVNMPGEMNGFGLARWIRENYSGLPVLMASGDVKKSEAVRELCAEESFFEKPYDLHAVVRQIRHTLNEGNHD